MYFKKGAKIAYIQEEDIINEDILKMFLED